LNITFHPFAPPPLLSRFVPFLAGRVTWPTQSSKSNFKSIDSGVWGLRVPKMWGFPLTLIVAFTTVLRTTVPHCDKRRLWTFCPQKKTSPRARLSYGECKTEYITVTYLRQHTFRRRIRPAARWSMSPRTSPRWSYFVVHRSGLWSRASTRRGKPIDPSSRRRLRAACPASTDRDSCYRSSMCTPRCQNYPLPTIRNQVSHCYLFVFIIFCVIWLYSAFQWF